MDCGSYSYTSGTNTGRYPRKPDLPFRSNTARILVNTSWFDDVDRYDLVIDKYPERKYIMSLKTVDEAINTAIEQGIHRINIVLPDSLRPIAKQESLF
jgi:hypothetical protein